MLELRVTKPVIEQVAREGSNQRQIAVRWDEDPWYAFTNASKSNPVVIRVGRLIRLRMADTNAIWATHQQTAEEIRNFDLLYELLSNYADHFAAFDASVV